MRRRGTIGALLLVSVGIVLGTTVFRSEIAQATGLAQSVTVANTPLPVREQNVDTNGNIKVHEQGTANVNVTNSSLTVAPPNTVTSGGDRVNVSTATGLQLLGHTVTATALSIHLGDGVTSVDLESGIDDPATFYGPADFGNASIVLTLTRPISFNSIRCQGNSGECSVSWVGAQP
jgi:hypothetical protein